jgi:hypothetical protein
MLNEAYPDWDVAFFEVHAQPIMDRADAYQASVRAADIVLSQPIHDGYRGRDDLSINWVRENVSPRGLLIVIPSMHFAAHQPSWHGGPFPGVDLLGAHLVASGLQPEEALQRLLATDLLADEEIELEIQKCIAEIVRREEDDRIDIRFSEFLEEHARHKLLFHVHNHPVREVAVFITNAILEKLGYPRRVLVEGQDYQWGTHVPPLPTLTRFLAARAKTPFDPQIYEAARMPGVPEMPLATFYGKVVEQLALVPTDELLSRIAASWPTSQFLQRLARNSSAIPGIDRWK